MEKISSEAVQEDEGEEMDEEDDDRVGKPRTRGTVGFIQNQTRGCCDSVTFVSNQRIGLAMLFNKKKIWPQ